MMKIESFRQVWTGPKEDYLLSSLVIYGKSDIVKIMSLRIFKFRTPDCLTSFWKLQLWKKQTKNICIS